MQFGFAFFLLLLLLFVFVFCFVFLVGLNNLFAVLARKSSDSERLAVLCVLQVEILHSEIEKHRYEMPIFLAEKYNSLKLNTACNNGLSRCLTEEFLNILMLNVWKGRKGK